jgi:predicted transposase/invertase (TIGR01784 family)
MPLGIRPTIDFAFKLVFGSPENKIALISLLNAILNLALPIVDVTLLNPYNLKDFEDDKLSILDVKAVDQSGAIYDIEMQLEIVLGIVQRLVYYASRLYAGQLKEGEEYFQIRPVYVICLANEILWEESARGHHAFRLTDRESGRVLKDTLEVHTIELPRYTLISEADLPTASLLECWIFWFLHAHEYEPEDLLKLLPQAAIRRATQAITAIAQQSEDKAMYDSREKAVRDQRWLVSAARLEGEREGEIRGKIEGKIELIRTLQGILNVPPNEEAELRAMTLEQLESLTNSLQEKARNRTSDRSENVQE